jgi:protein involved in polysaccharide export with SLBB domain
LTLSGGEVVNVPDAQKQLAARFPDGPKVWITGDVGRPQAYSIASPADATVLKAVASAGGVTQGYAKTAYIYRYDSVGVRKAIPIPLNDMLHRKAQDMSLQADDILLIPHDSDKKLPEYYDTHPPTAPWEKTK